MCLMPVTWDTSSVVCSDTCVLHIRMNGFRVKCSLAGLNVFPSHIYMYNCCWAALSFLFQYDWMCMGLVCSEDGRLVKWTALWSCTREDHEVDCLWYILITGHHVYQPAVAYCKQLLPFQYSQFQVACPITEKWKAKLTNQIHHTRWCFRIACIWLVSLEFCLSPRCNLKLTVLFVYPITDT